MKTLAETIGENIRAKRESMRISQRTLSEYLHLSHQTVVSFWETGKFCPNACSLYDLADVFGCSVDSLMGRDADA